MPTCHYVAKAGSTRGFCRVILTPPSISARCVEMGNRRFGGGARDVVRSYFLLFFIAYVELLRVFWFLWREILECSPYQGASTNQMSTTMTAPPTSTTVICHDNICGNKDNTTTNVVTTQRTKCAQLYRGNAVL
jgi:hypothetical protein